MKQVVATFDSGSNGRLCKPGLVFLGAGFAADIAHRYHRFFETILPLMKRFLHLTLIFNEMRDFCL